MDRRVFLKRGGTSVAALAALAGCTEETLEETETKPPFIEVDEEDIELPTSQRADVVEEGVLQAEEADIEDLDDFEGYLEEQDILLEELVEEEKIIEEKLDVKEEDVEVVEEEPHGEGLVLELEYVQPDVVESGMLHSIGLIAGGYASLVEAGYDAEKLEATVLDENHQPFGSFEVLTSWAEEYNEDITSTREYGSKPWIASKSE